MKKDHKNIVSMLNSKDGFIYGMLVDIRSNTFYVTRSNQLNQIIRVRTKDLDYNIFTKEGKALIDRYDNFQFLDDDMEQFDSMLKEIIQTNELIPVRRP